MRSLVMRRQRILMSLLLVFAFAGATFAIQGTAARAWAFPAQQIAERARSYGIGTREGQCKVFAQNVVNSVLVANGISARVGGYGSPGGAYFGAYQNAGGTLIGTNDGQPGDLIQTINPAQRNSDYPTWNGLHTAIIVARTSTQGTYVVRDSNWNLDEKVSEHSWAPASYAVARGAAAYVWRFGNVGSPPPPGPGPSDLYFVKTKDTGSGRVEVHSATAGSGYQTGQHSTTYLTPADADNGWFQMGRKG
ncbi:MAG: hypothetical protein U0U69_07370 [Acidimicrobiia bacterium]